MQPNKAFCLFPCGQGKLFKKLKVIYSTTEEYIIFVS